MGEHDQHRARLRKRFLEEGLDGFPSHNALELLLFYSIPRKDVNDISHRLMERFGSLDGVFDAPFEELLLVEGVGENTATLIRLIPQLTRKYLVAKSKSTRFVHSTKEAGAVLVPRFYGLECEVVYMLCMDGKHKVIDCRKLFSGSINSASVSVRKVVENAINSQSSSVVLAHNHTSGLTTPSPEDIKTTSLVKAALAAVGIVLQDHIIVAENDYFSMADDGLL